MCPLPSSLLDFARVMLGLFFSSVLLKEHDFIPAAEVIFYVFAAVRTGTRFAGIKSLRTDGVWIFSKRFSRVVSGRFSKWGIVMGTTEIE